MKILVGILFFALATIARVAESRLAILGDPGMEELAGILTAELSKASGVVLVEREELWRIAAEHDATAMLAKQDYRPLGQLLKADGLLVLTKPTTGQKGMEFVRLVAVDPGVVIGDLVLPGTAPAAEQAKVVSRYFVPLLPKLKTVAGNAATRISLFGLRFELDTPGAKQSERLFNTLLAERLSRESDVLVLERWQMDKLAWEKSLTADPTAPFWSGSYLLDGRIVEKGAELEISARLRPPGDAKPITIELKGRREALLELANVFAGQLKARLGQSAKPVPWDSVAEGRNYADLAGWALNNRLYDEGIAASEAAIAMGFHERSAEMLRVKAYSMWSSMDEKNDMPAHIAAALQAQRYLGAYFQHFGAMKEEDYYSPENPGILAKVTLNTGIGVLAGGYNVGANVRCAEELAQLRTLIRQNVRIFFEGNREDRESFLMDLAVSAPYFHDTPEETLEFYRKVLRHRFSAKNQWIAIWTRDRLARSGGGVYPWMITWKARDPSEMRDLWDSFVDNLLKSEDLQDQVDGYMFQYGSLTDKEKRRALLPGVCGFLWDHREAVVRSESPLIITGLKGVFGDSLAREAPDEVRPFTLKFFHFMFENAPLIDILTLWLLPRNESSPSQPIWTDEETQDLLRLIENYQKRVKSHPGYTAAYHHDIERVKTSLVFVHPSLANREIEHAPRALKVTRYWNPLRRDELKNLPDRKVGEEAVTWTWAERRIWLANKNHVFNVDPSTFETSLIPGPKEPDPTQDETRYRCGKVEVLPSLLFLIGRSCVWQYDRQKAAWSLPNLPLGGYASCVFQDSLYLLMGAGLIKFTPSDGSSETLISNRRNPPLHFLDGNPQSTLVGIFIGTNNRLCLLVEHWQQHQIYEYTPEELPWKKVLGRGGLWDRNSLFPDARGALVITTSPGEKDVFDQVLDLDRKAGTPAVLLTNSRVTKELVEGNPRWDLPEDLAAVVPGVNHYVFGTTDGKSLWLLRYRQRSSDFGGCNHTLYCFGPVSRASVKVPLEFVLSQDDLNSFSGDKRTLERIQLPRISQVLWTPKGLVIGAWAMPGFWFLPFADLKAYLEPAREYNK